jgi:hypothetical protein
LTEIDPLLIEVTFDEKPPVGFPSDVNGNLICAKCNTKTGIYIQNCLDVCKYVYMNMHLHLHLHSYQYKCICKLMNIYIYTYIYINIYIYI